MRYRVAVNGVPRLVASLAGMGYLNAHLNLLQRPGEDTRKRVVRFVGIDTNPETANLRSEWDEIELAEGDTVSFEILADGSGDPQAFKGELL